MNKYCIDPQNYGKMLLAHSSSGPAFGGVRNTEADQSLQYRGLRVSCSLESPDLELAQGNSHSWNLVPGAMLWYPDTLHHLVQPVRVRRFPNFIQEGTRAYPAVLNK